MQRPTDSNPEGLAAKSLTADSLLEQPIAMEHSRQDFWVVLQRGFAQISVRAEAIRPLHAGAVLKLAQDQSHHRREPDVLLQPVQNLPAADLWKNQIKHQEQWYARLVVVRLQLRKIVHGLCTGPKRLYVFAQAHRIQRIFNQHSISVQILYDHNLIFHSPC